MSPEDMRDIFGEDAAFSDFFSSMFERGQGRSDTPRRGRDREAAVEITLDEAFHGTTRALQIGERRIEARIPSGVHTGARVRLADQGSAGAAGGSAGDLFHHGLISLHELQCEADLRELRRARRLRDDLDLEHAVILIILRLRQRTVALQNEVTQLRRAAQAPPLPRSRSVWSEAERLILNEES